jgi:transposase
MSCLFVGVDVAKASLVVAIWREERGLHLLDCPNTPEGFQALKLALAQACHKYAASSLHLTIEPTGGYELGLAAFAHQQGWRLSRPNPAQVREWARGRGYRAKTDRVDARMLAHYGAEAKPTLWRPLPAEVAELELLLRRKEDVEQLLRQESNRQQALLERPGVPERVRKSLERVKEALEQELKELEQAIKQHLGQQAQLREQVKQLRSVPGSGRKTCCGCWC